MLPLTKSILSRVSLQEAKKSKIASCVFYVNYELQNKLAPIETYKSKMITSNMFSRHHTRYDQENYHGTLY